MTRFAVFLALLGAFSGTAEAQGSPEFPRRHSLEIAVGGAFLGGVDFGSIDATLNANQTPRAPYTLFETSSALSHAAAFEGRVAYHFTRVFSLEGVFGYARPSIETTISGDVEGVPTTIARERLSQFVVDVSGVVHLRHVKTGRAVPFVFGGAGYLRELHEADLVGESGHTYHLGGGLKLPLLMRRGFVRSLGLRVDARALFRSGGADLDRSRPTRATGAAGASLIVGF